MQFKFTSYVYHVLFIHILAILAYTNVLAQPQYGCHLIHYVQGEREITPAERAIIQSGLERSDSFNILNYEITADLTRFSSQILIANTIVSFSPRMVGLTHLRLDLEGLTVDSILFKDEQPEYNYDGRFIDIYFAEALKKDSVYDIQVYYHGTPIICNGDEFGGFYFENGVAYNLGIGINCIPHNYGRVWFPCFDNFVEHSTYKYNIISSEGRIGYAIGNLVFQDTISSDTIRREFVMDQPIPTYLSHIAVGPYTDINFVVESEYSPVPVKIVVKPKDVSDARHHFNNIGKALNMLEYWYGPYMWDRIGYNITSRGAMEHPTGIAYPRSVIGGNNFGLQTHELAHHWWGDVVTLREDIDMWIKEGPASYAEQQIIEWTSGEKAFKNAVRLNNYNMLRTAHIADGGYLPLSPMPQRITYGVTTYNKGASMFHNLRTYLGDSLYRVGMQYVLEERTYGNITAYSFRDILMEGTGVNLTDFFNDWIFSPGWSDFSVNNYDVKEAGTGYQVSGTVIQKQYHDQHYHQNVPLTLTAYFKDLSRLDTTIYVSGKTTVFTFRTSQKPTALIVNEKYSLCLASVSNFTLVSGEGTFNVVGTFLNTFCTLYKGEDRVAIEHHLTPPPPLNDETKNLELSRNHYWKVAMARPGLNTYGFNYRYSSGDKNFLDYYVARDGADSLLLLYKKDAESGWVEYSEYRVISTGTNAGVVVTQNAKPGLYTLGHGQKGVYTKVVRTTPTEITIFPTLVSNNFQVSGLNQGKIKVYSINGLKIGEYNVNSGSTLIELPVILPGLYVVQVYNSDSQLIHVQKIIKK